MPRHFYKPIDCRLINAGLIGLLLAVITAGTASAKLRSFAPSWVEEFPQQDCRVVYIASVPLAEELADSRVDAERCRAIRATYPQSGVYTRSEPPKLLWQLDISEMDGPVYLRTCPDRPSGFCKPL